jgi:GNAT superfamily N-acetyltransferase
MGETFAMRPAIRRATAEDAGQVAELIATATAGLKAPAYLVPDRRERHKIMIADVLILVDHAVQHGEIDLIDDGPAAAVWFLDTAPRPDPEDYARRLAEATGEWAERFRERDALFAANRPADPCHYLAFLAVHPNRQNEGLGTALLRHHHARLGGMPAYLEANDPRNRDLYARHGYEERASFTLPDGTMFWPMWRPVTSA